MAATLAAGLFFYSSCTPAEKTDTKDYTQYVNTFIGGADNGHTFPGACYPFGMIQTSPVTGAVGWRYCSEYVYEDSLIWGFTQTHLNGTGCMDLGDILVMPVTGTRARAWDAYRSHFSKDKEAATPGYYTAELSDPQVKAELTASIHAALHRYTYHKADSASILIDLQHGPAWREEQYHSQVNSCEVNWEDAQTLTGHVNNTVWVNQDYFFVMKFNRPVVDSLYLPMGETEKGKRIIASFDMQPGDELMMKVALSTTSIDGAKKNLEAEIPAWDFEGVRATAHNEWNNYLSRIEIEGTDDEKTNFYTCFYHALIQPNQISDVDGMYRNAADSIVKAGTGTFYSTFSLWDTYRAAHPFYTLVIPERVDGFVNSLIEQGEVQGFLPIWGLWGKENFCMIGNHGVSVIAEAYRKGFRGFDAERAFNIIKKTQTVSHPLKSDWEVYTKYGYFPTDLIKAESVSSTLESVYDDYAAADMARRMGKEEDAAYFAKRADYYKNMFEHICEQWLRGAFGYKLEVLSEIYRLLYSLMNESLHRRTKAEHHTIYKGILYLENNYMSDISVKELSDMCNVSESSFRRLFKKYKKMSPITYKNYLRIIKAADLLKSGEYSVKEAAYAVSLPDICYFYKLFVRFMHDTPKSFVPVGGASDTPSV